ncbi:hypothetical protein BDV93DRAFT_509254 [Ceratobasidium sp. AG-I]|nr:hypothetical protein BDV93DRAFT_509254 [Ceratobasidium sp. AG-I]
MPDWITVSGVVTNVASMLDLGYRYTPYEAIRGRDAEVVLKEVGDILRNANTVLENQKDVLSSEVYATLKTRHRSCHWRMIDEKQQNRALKDEAIQQRRSHFQLSTDEESLQARAIELLSSVEAYQTDVLHIQQSLNRLRAEKSFYQPSLTKLSPRKLETLSSNRVYPHAPRQVYQQFIDNMVLHISRYFGGFTPSTRYCLYLIYIESTGDSLPHNTAGLVSLRESSPEPVATERDFDVTATETPRLPSSSVDLGTGVIEPTSGPTSDRRLIVLTGNAQSRVGIIENGAFRS